MVLYFMAELYPSPLDWIGQGTWEPVMGYVDYWELKVDVE